MTLANLRGGLSTSFNGAELRRSPDEARIPEILGLPRTAPGASWNRAGQLSSTSPRTLPQTGPRASRSLRILRQILLRRPQLTLDIAASDEDMDWC